MFACFSSACQPTPEEDAVIGKWKNSNEIIQRGAEDADDLMQVNDTLFTKLDAPEHWNVKSTALNDKLNIIADTEVKLPGVSQLPAATASLREFTQEDLDKIAEICGVSKDAVWTETGIITKENIEKMLIEDKALIARGVGPDKNNPDFVITDDMVEKAKESIKYLEQEYIIAPYESELKKIEFTIDTPDDTFIGFEGTTQVDDQPFYFMASNQYAYDGVISVYANYGTDLAPFGEVKIDAPLGVALTREQAAKQAEEIAAQLTDELSLCHIAPATTGPRDETSRTWGWACVFMREINGCPTAYETTELSNSLEAVNVPVTYEKMIIVMDDAGMTSFTWDTPMTVESVDNPDVSLLSFPEISQRAIEQISQRFSDSVTEDIVDRIDWGDPGCTANIVDVELGLSRISKENSSDYYYLPVWKFFIELEHTDGYYERTGVEPPGNDDYIDENGYPSNINFEYSRGLDVITLNALDGTVIDNSLGY